MWGASRSSKRSSAADRSSVRPTSTLLGSEGIETEAAGFIAHRFPGILVHGSPSRLEVGLHHPTREVEAAVDWLDRALAALMVGLALLSARSIWLWVMSLP